jgi:hypothetical protein
MAYDLYHLGAAQVPPPPSIGGGCVDIVNKIALVRTNTL